MARAEDLLDRPRIVIGPGAAVRARRASLPAEARFLDPFLLVVVYCALVGGETHGMLAGAAAGWVQDVHFGGSVLGLSALAEAPRRLRRRPRRRPAS